MLLEESIMNVTLLAILILYVLFSLLTAHPLAPSWSEVKHGLHTSGHDEANLSFCIVDAKAGISNFFSFF